LDHRLPPNIVVIPETFELVAKWPARMNADSVISTAVAGMSSAGYPLQLAFDFSVSNERNAVFLSDELLTELRMHDDKSEITISHYVSSYNYSDAQLPVAIELLVALIKAYTDEVKRLHESLHRTVTTLCEKGYAMSNDEFVELRKAVRFWPLNVGGAAKKANWRIEEFVTDKVFLLDENSQRAIIDTRKIRQFEAVVKAYEPSERAVRSSQGAFRRRLGSPPRSEQPMQQGRYALASLRKRSASPPLMDDSPSPKRIYRTR
jgi:hypothetical protein